MIQFILILLGLVFPNNNNNNSATSDYVVRAQNSAVNPSESAEDTSGETEQTPPPRKK